MGQAHTHLVWLWVMSIAGEEWVCIYIQGDDWGISGKFTQVIQTEHTRNKMFLIRTHMVEEYALDP